MNPKMDNRQNQELAEMQDETADVRRWRRSCQAIPSTTSRICTLSPPRAQNDNELPASPHHITYLHTLAKLATHL
ncbi:hypothetical protein FSI69_008435 [Escherichia coli]|nr:hypothetical protein [Escherichia coli]